MVGNLKILKFFYNALLTGLPSITYNPYNKNILHAPFCVNKFSTYINYCLDDNQVNLINNYLDENTNNFKLVKTKILDDEKPSNYYLSVNIYNCSSPIFNFLSEEPVTRCEINTYVVDEKGVLGTLIMNYDSNILSLDPDNLFKKSVKDSISFKKFNPYILGEVHGSNYDLKFNYNTEYRMYYYSRKVDSKLIKYSDNIFYNCGLYDKLYYDSSLIHNNVMKCNTNNVEFTFLNVKFENPESVFYFSQPINFVGGLWFNIYN